MVKQKIPQDRYSLIDYLSMFNWSNPQELELRVDEIVINIQRVMAPYIRGERGEELRKYYVPAMKEVESAYKERDFIKKFPDAITSLRANLCYQ